VLIGLVVLAGCGGGEPTYTARFSNARGLVPGNDVRVAGAIAGRVRDVRLAPDGSAEVRFTVASRAAPRADASAAIRPVDLLGDTYLALSPGAANTPLHGPISTARTANAPRLDELLATFTPPVRSALQALIVQAGLALDQRGVDVARTTVQLRAALRAADRATHELDGQDAALARLVPAAERAAGQLSARAGDLGPLIDDVARTLDATATHSRALGATIAGLPATLAQVRGTATELGRTARAARPVAATLRDSAPALAAAVRELRPFTARLQTTATALRPALRSLRRTLAGGRTSLPKLDRATRALLGAAPDIRALVAAIEPAAPGIAKGFLENFPDQAAEPGTQPLDPFADARRHYWRGAAVMSCEAFGVAVKPGCLTDVLARFAPARSGKPAVKPKPALTLGRKPSATATPPAPTAPSTPALKSILDFLLHP